CAADAVHVFAIQPGVRFSITRTPRSARGVEYVDRQANRSHRSLDGDDRPRRLFHPAGDGVNAALDGKGDESEVSPMEERAALRRRLGNEGTGGPPRPRAGPRSRI